MDKTLRNSRILTLLFIVFTVVLTITAFYFINSLASNAVMSEVRDNLKSTAAVAASQINGETFASLNRTSTGTPAFIDLRNSLHRIKQSDPEIRYIYTMRQNGSAVEFVVDGDYGISSDAADPGDIYENATPAMLAGFAVPSSDLTLSMDQWGDTISGYAPIRDGAGKSVGLVGVDMDSGTLTTVMGRLRTFDYTLLGIIIILFAIGSVIFDIRRSRVEEIAQTALGKLNQLNSIIRHDIFNTLTGLIGFVEMAEESDTLPEVKERLSTIARLSNKIQQQIAFTRDYQDLGLHLPTWQNVLQTAQHQVSRIELPGIDVTLDFGGLEIYADPLFDRVFAILFENSRSHGEKVTRIHGYFEQSKKGITLYLEDNGVGIPSDKKEQIFTRKEYRDTGLGLFLSREILALTGITINETGVYGSGARFEIHIPKGKARFKTH